MHQRRQRESAEQRAFFRWRDLTVMATPELYPGLAEMFAIPNGGKRSKREAQLLKAEGVKAGVHDTFLPVPLHGFAGLWIELKAPKPHDAVVSKEQKAWLAKMQARGYAARVCYGWIDMAETVKAYYRGEMHASLLDRNFMPQEEVICPAM